MHELSIALSMIDLATEEARRLRAERINAIHLKIGALSGVVKDALLFSFEVASAGTLLEGSSLLVEDVPVVIYCDECQTEQQLSSIQLIGCPACGTLSAQIISGKELEFVAMEIEGEGSRFQQAGETPAATVGDGAGFRNAGGTPAVTVVRGPTF